MKLRIAEPVDAQSKIGIVILAAGESARMGTQDNYCFIRGKL